MTKMAADASTVKLSSGIAHQWWQSPWLAVALVAAYTIPLWIPSVPPLVDLPAHMGRYRIELDLVHSPFFHQWFAFKWALITNLGVDLLIVPLGKLWGVEVATKMIVIGIVVMTALSFFWIAWEIHGAFPPTTAFAVPFAYGYAFQFGFVNYCLSMGLALLSFALWLHLGRQGRWKLRAGLFLGISPLVWLAHAFGWGVLGLLCFSAQFVIAFRKDAVRSGFRRFWAAGRHAALVCLPLTIPFFLTFLWVNHGSGQTGDWTNIRMRTEWILHALRDRWLVFDLVSLAMVYGLMIAGMVWRKWLRFDAVLGIGALVLAIMSMALPRHIFGSDYAAVRLTPFAAALGLLALRPGPSLTLKGQWLVAVGAVAFALVRLTATTISYALYARSYDQELAALDVIPEGSRILALVGYVCDLEWGDSRLRHLPSMAIVRKQAFTNDQFQFAGSQLLRVTYAAAGRFNADPSEMVMPKPCFHFSHALAATLATFPRTAFDFVWIIGIPRAAWPQDPALRPVWSRDDSVLYRIGPSLPATTSRLQAVRTGAGRAD